MSAQPSEAPTQRITLPRTIRAVRSALTADERAEFAADLEDANAPGLPQVVERWWMHAVINLTPGTWERSERARVGTLATVPIEEVVPELRASR